MTTATRTRPNRLTVTTLQLEVALLVGLGALQVGLLAGAAADRFGPAVLFLLPVLAVVAAVCVERVSLAPCLVVLVVPIGLTPLPGGIEVVQAAAIVVVAIVVLRRLAGGSAPLLVPRTLYPGVALVLIALLSTAGAADVDAALRQDISLVLSLLLVCATASACSTPGQARRVAATFAAVGSVVCLLGLQATSQLEAVNRGQTVNNRARGTFTEPNQFGVFCAIVLLVALGLYLGARSTRERLTAAAFVTSAVVGLVVSLSRGGWIGAMLGTAVLLLVLPEARRRLLGLALALLVTGTVVVVVQQDRPEVQVVRDRVATFGDVRGNPYDDRPAIWAEGRRQALERPLLGQGPAQYPYVALRAAETATVAPLHAHNVLLNTAAELGLVAVGLVVLFTLGALRAAQRAVRRLERPADRALAAGLAGSLSAVVGQGLVDFTLRNAVVISLLSVLLGLLLALDRIAGQQPSSVSFAAQQRVP